jgi:hypothetical protein
MTNPTFKARVRPELHPAAQELVNIYEATPGSTGPGCCPEALAAVLDRVYGSDAYFMQMESGKLSALLRGEQL